MNTGAKQLLALGLAFLAGEMRGADLFDAEIRPLLQKRCVECHGSKKQKGELRLDAKVFAFRGGVNGAVVVPGSAEQSALIQRVLSEEEAERMPPKGERLSGEEVSALKKWIEAGAHWPENDADREAQEDRRLRHWSVLPVRTEFPSGASIDFFVRDALVRKGLAMSPEADRRTLIRRVTNDLHGLPPSPERVKQFVEDPDPDAYEKLVDELLASPHYGERWARHWLDIAHYADTHGFERDKLRPHAWRYRDYVIDSLNADKPYDVFVREQVAGDVIAPEDPGVVCGTGFLAAGPWDFVGQVEARSEMLRRAARAADMDDMVTQVMTATMGITINCARCHDHKLDPITQREYYGLWAVFAGVKRGDREMNAAQARRVKSERARLEGEIRKAGADLAVLEGGSLDLADMIGGGDGRRSGVAGRGIDLARGVPVTERRGFQKEVQTNRLQKVEWTSPKPGAAGLVKWVFVPDGRQRVPIDHQREVEGVPVTSGLVWDAIRNGVLNAQKGTRIDSVDYAQEGHSILGMHANSGVTFDLEKIRKASGFRGLHFTAMVGFGADSSAAQTRADFTVFVDDVLKFQRLRMLKSEHAPLAVEIPETAKTLTFIATDGGDGIGSDLLFLGDARLSSSIQADALTEEEKARAVHLRGTLVRLRKELSAVGEVEQVYAVVSDPNPPSVKVQRRGDPEDEPVEVQPGTIAWVRHAAATFGDNTLAEGERRRMLAEWIVHPDNPLTRRVLVNRLWHHHFGRGIVGTPSDFGLGGEAPSHPELLDWLSEELAQNGWRLKPLHKRILLSAAYRQTSLTVDPAASAVDAQNRFLWRQNPRRLDAESLRDAVLAVSGKLNPERGGPGFRDFRYTEAYAPIYEYLTPDSAELWRRSIYRFVVRTTPHRFMTTLDCPDPANMTPARVQTTTALQALTLSNNDFMLKQAEYLAERIQRETASLDDGVRRAFRLCFQREPDASECREAQELAREQGLFPLCRLLLNANEFVYLD